MVKEVTARGGSGPPLASIKTNASHPAILLPHKSLSERWIYNLRQHHATTIKEEVDTPRRPPLLLPVVVVLLYNKILLWVSSDSCVQQKKAI